MTLELENIGLGIIEEIIIRKNRSEESLKKYLKSTQLEAYRLLKYDPTPNQFSAVVLLSNNIDTVNFRKSNLLEYYKNKNIYVDYRKFHKWHRGNGKVLKGLALKEIALRRIKEIELFIK